MIRTFKRFSSSTVRASNAFGRRRQGEARRTPRPFVINNNLAQPAAAAKDSNAVTNLLSSQWGRGFVLLSLLAGLSYFSNNGRDGIDGFDNFDSRRFGKDGKQPGVGGFLRNLVPGAKRQYNEYDTDEDGDWRYAGMTKYIQITDLNKMYDKYTLEVQRYTQGERFFNEKKNQMRISDELGDEWQFLNQEQVGKVRALNKDLSLKLKEISEKKKSVANELRAAFLASLPGAEGSTSSSKVAQGPSSTTSSSPSTSSTPSSSSSTASFPTSSYEAFQKEKRKELVKLEALQTDVESVYLQTLSTILTKDQMARWLQQTRSISHSASSTSASASNDSSPLSAPLPSAALNTTDLKSDTISGPTFRFTDAAINQMSPKVFVLDFVGDVAASQVGNLTEEISTLLQVARPSIDRVIVRLKVGGVR